MKFSPEELSWIGQNKVYLKSILEKKYQDILTEMIYEEDDIKAKVLKRWARECKDLVSVLSNAGKIAPKQETQKNTGI